MKNLICSLLLLIPATVATAAPYVGATIGYLIDAEESLISGHVGYNLTPNTGATHGIELEVSETTFREGLLKASLTPIMANYRLVAPFGDRVDFFGGLGLGLSRVRVAGVGIASGIRDSDSAFTVQAFGGVALNVTPKLSFTAGLRHLRVGKAKLFNIKDTVGDDTSLEAGVRIRF